MSWEYTVTPSTRIRRFVCVGDRSEYRELSQDPTTSVWYVNPRYGIEPTDPVAFELVQFLVDGQPLRIRHGQRGRGLGYSVDLGEATVEAAKPVTLSYTYRTVVPVAGHLLHLDLEQPTKGITIDLDYGDCGIDYLNVVDFIASSERTRVSHSPASVPGKRVSVGFDGWVFPRSGVAFVWVLDDNASSDRSKSAQPAS